MKTTDKIAFLNSCSEISFNGAAKTSELSELHLLYRAFLQAINFSQGFLYWVNLNLKNNHLLTRSNSRTTSKHLCSLASTRPSIFRLSLYQMLWYNLIRTQNTYTHNSKRNQVELTNFRNVISFFCVHFSCKLLGYIISYQSLAMLLKHVSEETPRSCGIVNVTVATQLEQQEVKIWSYYGFEGNSLHPWEYEAVAKLRYLRDYHYLIRIIIRIIFSYLSTYY